MENKISGVTFILIKKSGEILMQLRDENSKHCPNMWCFPGGNIEAQETALQAVIREVKEEFGIKLIASNCHELMIHKLTYGTNALVFACLVEDNQTPVLHEGKAMRWMNINEIKKIKLGFEQNTVVVPVLENFLSTQKV